MSLITSIFVAILGKVAADEIKDWVSWFPPKLIRWSAARFEKDLQERYEEEWLAHAQDLPSPMARLWHSVGCAWAALQVNNLPLRFLLKIIFRPYAEVCAPVALLILVSMAVAFRALGIHGILFSDPEILRVSRLRKAAGGLCVLGLTDLELRMSDLRRSRSLDQTLAAYRRLIHRNIVLEVLDQENGRVLRRYELMVLRVLVKLNFITDKFAKLPTSVQRL
jgi:hypothetical protein